MLAIGDKVLVLKYSDKRYEGKQGEIALITPGFKPTSQPNAENERLPKPTETPFYLVKLDDGKELYNLRESQLRKL